MRNSLHHSTQKITIKAHKVVKAIKSMRMTTSSVVTPPMVPMVVDKKYVGIWDKISGRGWITRRMDNEEDG